MSGNKLWEQRFRASSMSLPEWALDQPQHNIYRSNSSGVFEIYTWERNSDTHQQATSRKSGTYDAQIEPSGNHIWWFNDTDGNEFGQWHRQPFTGGPGSDEIAIPDLDPAYPGGLILGRQTVAVGQSDDAGSRIYLWPYTGPARQVYQHTEDASVHALSTNEKLLAITHSEHGDSLHPDIRIIEVADGSTVGELADGPGKGVYPIGFSPLPNDGRLLVSHERRGRTELLLWNPLTGLITELDIDLPGELSATWSREATALLITAEHNARCTAWRYELASGALTLIDGRPGVITALSARPNAIVEYSWCDAAHPTQLRTTDTSELLLHPAGQPAPPSVPIRDAWVDGPGGRIHALISAMDSNQEIATPRATVFSIHGGPHHHDEDRFSPYRAALVDHGYVVIEVNYRGSTGYGSVWRDELIGQPGLTELADIAAVQDWAIQEGISDPTQCVLAGYSWGGYLTLLGLGTQPQRWAAGIAGIPVADYIAAYEDEMEPLKAMDRVLFGGTPKENPELWHQCSPLTYVKDIQAPVLILAGENDPRCPLRQIENYVAALKQFDKRHELYRFDAGHGSLVVEKRIEMTRVELEFLKKYTPVE